MRDNNNRRLRELVQQCLLGDEDAWDKTVEVITPVILSICRSMRLSRDESLDIFGQVCYLLLKNLENLKSPDKLLSYVATTTRREILATRRKAQTLEEFKNSGLSTAVPQAESDPETSAERAQNLEILVAALLRLPEPESRLIWHLFLDENEPTYEEISELLGRPVSSIGPTRARILEKLRKILRKMGYRFGVF